jgi:CheY-like chemotaxis protein
MTAAAVLVADDNSTLRLLMALALAEDGHHVETAVDGVEALEAIRRHVPDLVVLDLQMPNLDGWEVIRACRADPDTRAILIVVVSAAYRGWRDLDVQGFLAKPFDLEHLCSTVERLLAAR